MVHHALAKKYWELWADRTEGDFHWRGPNAGNASMKAARTHVDARIVLTHRPADAREPGTQNYCAVDCSSRISMRSAECATRREKIDGPDALTRMTPEGVSILEL